MESINDGIPRGLLMSSNFDALLNRSVTIDSLVAQGRSLNIDLKHLIVKWEDYQAAD